MRIKDSIREFTIHTKEKMLGTIPTKRDIFVKFLVEKNGLDLEELKEDLDMVPGLDFDSEGEPVVDGKGTGVSGFTTFYSDVDGIYLFNYHVLGFLKEAGNVLKEQVPNKMTKDGKPVVGIKNLKSKIDQYVFVEPRQIWLKEKPDGAYQRPLKAMTMRGPRVSLACSHYVDPLSFDIEIILVENKEISWDTIETLLDYGYFKGIGQWRNASWGSFTWEPKENRQRVSVSPAKAM